MMRWEPTGELVEHLVPGWVHCLSFRSRAGLAGFDPGWLREPFEDPQPSTDWTSLL